MRFPSAVLRRMLMELLGEKTANHFCGNVSFGLRPVVTLSPGAGRGISLRHSPEIEGIENKRTIAVPALAIPLTRYDECRDSVRLLNSHEISRESLATLANIRLVEHH